MSRVRIGGASSRRNAATAENSSVFRCALKVVMVVELFVTGDKEFQTAVACRDTECLGLEIDPCRQLTGASQCTSC